MPETTLPSMLDIGIAKQLATEAARIAQAVESRNHLIRVAIADGASLREVGEAAGLSHTAVKFIAHGRPG